MELSDRERMIAERYAAGQTYMEIAGTLHIAPSTVRNHLASVYRKLDVGNKPALIRELSTRNSDIGILPPPREPARTAPVLQSLDEITPPAGGGASIAVMPFMTIGPAELDYIGHGVAADLQHDLTRCHDLLVAGRSSCLALNKQEADSSLIAKRLGVQYVLQGTVRSDRKRLRLTAELVDGSTGMVLWSERYDRILNDILEIEAEIARAIAANLSLQIDDAQLASRQHLDATELTAYDWRLRGNRFLELGGRENLATARECYRRALDLEPRSAAAYAGLSMCFGYECDSLLTDDYGESLERHIELAERAIAVDESDSRGHYAMSCALLFSHEYERAGHHAARGLELNPSEYHNICTKGYSLLSLGRAGESVEYFTDSLRRNPLAPNSCLLAVGLIEYLDANYGQAANALSRLTSYRVQRASTLAAACAQAGYKEAARKAALEFQRVSEDVPMCPKGTDAKNWREFWRLVYPYLPQGAFEHMLEGMSKAALPV